MPDLTDQKAIRRSWVKLAEQVDTLAALTTIALLNRDLGLRDRPIAQFGEGQGQSRGGSNSECCRLVRRFAGRILAVLAIQRVKLLSSTYFLESKCPQHLQ